MSEDHNPRFVMTIESMEKAEAIAMWLTEKKFPAEVYIPEQDAAPGDSLGLSPEVSIPLQIWVIDAANAEPARQLIADQKEAFTEMQAKLDRRASLTGTVTATCEECGKNSEWAANLMGTTQECPHCLAYMDVPDPEEKWDESEYAGTGPES